MMAFLRVVLKTIKINKGKSVMRTQKVIAAMVSLAMFVVSAVQVLANDKLPIFSYKGTVKYYAEGQQKVSPYTYDAYIVVNSNTNIGAAVWYGGTGTGKWFWVDTEAPVNFERLDNKGNVYFTFGYTDVGFGKITTNRTDGVILTASVTGTIADPENRETGTFSVRYNSSLTKKAIASGINALDQVIAELAAKQYIQTK